MPLALSEIHIYPIKSLGGISLQEAKLTERGLEFDRRWMLLDDKGNFMTQRQTAKMALLRVVLEDNQLKVSHLHNNISPLYIPLSAPTTEETLTAPIWDDTSMAVKVSKDADKWFSDVLGQASSLVYMPEQGERSTTGKVSGRKQKVSFADAYPILMIGQASLDDLNSRLDKAVPMNRFRPNLVFTGGNPFEEDQWHEFSIRNTRFWAEKPCARCVVTTINQQTGEKGKEPLATLAKYRRMNSKILFGENITFEPGGSIRVGDTILVKSYKDASQIPFSLSVS